MNFSSVLERLIFVAIPVTFSENIFIASQIFIYMRLDLIRKIK